MERKIKTKNQTNKYKWILNHKIKKNLLKTVKINDQHWKFSTAYAKLEVAVEKGHVLA